MGAASDLVNRNVLAWNERRFDDWAGTFTDDATIVGPGGVSGTGSEIKRRSWDFWHDAFPDNRVEVVHIAEDGELAVLEAVFDGTHTGPLRADTGEFPPTGRRISVSYTATFTTRGERFTSGRLQFDQQDVMTQLGLTGAGA